MSGNNDVITKADIEGLKVHIDGRIMELEKKIDDRMNVLERKIEVNAAKIDMLQHSQTVNITLLGVVIGVSALVITLAPTILELFKINRKEKMTMTCEKSFERK